MTTRCEHAGDAGAYLLTALEPDEARRFAAHAETCAECRQAVADLQVVADTLALAAPQVPAPAALKGRIMAVVESEAQLLRAAGPEADRPPRRASRRLGLRLPDALRVRPLAAAALACGLLAAGIVTGAALQDGAPDVRTIAARAPAAASVDVALHEDGRAELVMAGMPAPPDGRVYQVWLLRDGRPQPTRTLFTVARDGRARVQIDRPVAGSEQVLVTDEPPEGSQVPTRAPVVVASLD